jgi:hypothetical protein
VKDLRPRPTSRIRPRGRRGRRFELSGRYLFDDRTWTLVHGVVRSSDVDSVAHAWLRRDGWVYDAVEDKSYRADEYAAKYARRELAAFSAVAAAKMAIDTKNWDPLAEPEALARLCRREHPKHISDGGRTHR